MSTAPRVSVCIPTYKGAATLVAAIESVLAQTFTDLEVVVIDDNSPDDTAAVMARIGDPRVRYLRNSANLGPEGNWNRCLQEARGRYFKLLPHDDLLHPDCLARQVQVLEADTAQHLSLVFSAREVIGPDGRLLMVRGCPGVSEGRIAAAELVRACVRRGTNLIGEPGAVLLRRELAQRLERFDGQDGYVIDLDFWFRLLEHGDAYYLAQPLAAFRVSRSQWSVVIGRGQSAEFRRFIQRTLARRPWPLGWLDRLCGRFTPALNNLARLAFYRVYL